MIPYGKQDVNQADIDAVVSVLRSDFPTQGPQVPLFEKTVHYIPIHTQPNYLQFGFKEGDFPNSEDYYKNSISLPLFYSMTLKQQEKVFNTLMKMLQ